ncbi:Germacrene D synthase-like protein, partial [Drosera capensis]
MGDQCHREGSQLHETMLSDAIRCVRRNGRRNRKGRKCIPHRLCEGSYEDPRQGLFRRIKMVYSDELPTYEEYMKIALVTSGYPMLIITSLVGMGDGVTKEDFDWLLGGPKIVEAASIITRLMDDMVENKRQLEEQGVREPSAVDCYTYQYGVSEQQAHQVLNKFVLDAWKDINEAYMRPSPASKSVLNVALNLSR